jgi:hypothetical protein
MDGWQTADDGPKPRRRDTATALLELQKLPLPRASLGTEAYKRNVEMLSKVISPRRMVEALHALDAQHDRKCGEAQA